VVRTKQEPEERTKDKVVRTNQVTKSGKVFELDERTALFGEAAIKLANGLSRTPVTTPLVSQFVRSSTSVGANYMEAGAAQSGKDFDHKIGICKKEARETMHWLRMLAVADESSKLECRTMWREAHELTMIFSAILNKRRG
jgi:four helix bundle protein